MQLRKATGLSQEQLAAQLDVSRQSVSKWELNEAIPEVGKIVLLSDLFGVSTDELLKDGAAVGQMCALGLQNSKKAPLEQIARRNFAHKRITMGFRTAVIGLILFVLEFAFLPIFAGLQKAHVDAHGFYTDYMEYAGMQPMPIIFTLTGILVLLGLILLLWGTLERKLQQ